MGNSAGREFPLVFSEAFVGESVWILLLFQPSQFLGHSTVKENLAMTKKKRQRNNWLRQRELEIIPAPRALGGIKNCGIAPLKKTNVSLGVVSYTK